MTALIVPTDAPAVAGPPQGHWTYADWETLPNDGNCYEVIVFDRLPTIQLPIAQLFAGAPDTML